MEHKIDDIITLKPEQLNEGQADFIRTNADQLTDDDQTKFESIINPKEPDNKDDANANDGGGDGGDNKDDKDKKDDADVPFDAEKLEINTRNVPETPKDVKPTDPNAPIKPPEDDDDAMLPEDKKAFQKVIDEQLQPFKDKIAILEGKSTGQNNILDVTKFVSRNPEYKKYEAGILKYAESPHYSNVSIENIALIISAKDQQAIGAEKERVATKKAKDTQDGGNQGGDAGGDGNKKKDPLAMSDAEFKKEKEKVLGHPL